MVFSLSVHQLISPTTMSSEDSFEDQREKRGSSVSFFGAKRTDSEQFCAEDSEAILLSTADEGVSSQPVSEVAQFAPREVLEPFLRPFHPYQASKWNYSPPVNDAENTGSTVPSSLQPPELKRHQAQVMPDPYASEAFGTLQPPTYRHEFSVLSPAGATVPKSYAPAKTLPEKKEQKELERLQRNVDKNASARAKAAQLRERIKKINEKSEEDWTEEEKDIRRADDIRKKRKSAQEARRRNEMIANATLILEKPAAERSLQEMELLETIRKRQERKSQFARDLRQRRRDERKIILVRTTSAGPKGTSHFNVKAPKNDDVAIEGSKKKRGGQKEPPLLDTSASAKASSYTDEESSNQSIHDFVSTWDHNEKSEAKSVNMETPVKTAFVLARFESPKASSRSLSTPQVIEEKFNETSRVPPSPDVLAKRQARKKSQGHTLRAKQKERAESILAKPEHERAEEDTSFLRTYQDRKKEKNDFNRKQRQNKREAIKRILVKPLRLRTVEEREMVEEALAGRERKNQMDRSRRQSIQQQRLVEKSQQTNHSE